MINYTNYTVAQRLTLSPFHNLHTTLIIAIAANAISQVNRAGKACVSEHTDKRSTSGSHHDIVTLHLSLLVGQFVILHLQARAKRRKGTKHLKQVMCKMMSTSLTAINLYTVRLSSV